MNQKYISISFICKNSAKKLNEWINKLENYLSNNQKPPIEQIELYIINKKLLDQYIMEVININKSENEINSNYSKFMNINYNHIIKNLTNYKNINSLQEIFPLNKSCWESLPRSNYNEPNVIKGNFYNKLLLFDLKKYIKSVIIYCLFFLDDKKQLR